jgi:hypothetical protein
MEIASYLGGGLARDTLATHHGGGVHDESSSHRLSLRIKTEGELLQVQRLSKFSRGPGSRIED